MKIVKKKCSTCKKDKILNNFCDNKSSSDGYNNICRKCISAYERGRRLRLLGDDIKYCLTCNHILSINYSSNYCSRDCRQNAVPETWNRATSLLTGLIASDGCLYDNDETINFASKHKYLTEGFAFLSKSTKNVRKTTHIINNKEYYYYIIEIVNYPLLNLLKQVGLTPRKSLTIPALNFPKTKEDLFWLFLRGEIEGDGSIEKSGVNICSASDKFSLWIINELNKRNINSYLYKTKTTKNNTMYTIFIPAKFSSILYKNMYLKYKDIKIYDHSTITFNDVAHREKRDLLKKLSESRCKDCKINVCLKSERCSNCCSPFGDQKTKIIWPEVSIIIKDVEKYGYRETGRKLGVSDSAIRKYLKRNNVILYIRKDN